MSVPTQSPWRTGADVMSHQVDAGASILTRMRLTLVDLDLAVLSSVAWHALQYTPTPSLLHDATSES